MKLKSLFFVTTLGVSLSPAVGHAQTARAAREAQKTVAAVKAVDGHWHAIYSQHSTAQ